MYEEYIPFIQRVALEMASDMASDMIQGTVVIRVPLAIFEVLDQTLKIQCYGALLPSSTRSQNAT
jgi:hypothetical protein